MTDEADLSKIETMTDDELLIYLGREAAGASFVSLNPMDAMRKGREALEWARIQLQPAICGSSATTIENGMTVASIGPLFGGVVAPSPTFSVSRGFILIASVALLRMGIAGICQGYRPA
jgi:hypothetical protein